MTGRTRSSTKRRTLSLTAFSSSERRESIPKKSNIGNGELGKGKLRLREREWEREKVLRRDGSLRARRNPNLTRLPAKRRPMIDGESGFVLPLVNHLMEQCLTHLVPSVTPEMTPADGDLRGVAGGSGR